MYFKESCNIVFLQPDFQNRVRVSIDCRKLHLSPLKKEDAGRYTAGIVLPNKKSVDESFGLQVLLRLVDSDLKVTCTPEGTGIRTWQLNCSTGTWEDRVNIRWTSSAQSTGPTPGSSVIQFVSLDLNATCTAENPVSQASRTVSLKQVCAGQTKNFYRLPLWALLCLSKVGSLLLLGCLGLILVMKTKKAVGGERLRVRYLPEEPITTTQDVQRGPDVLSRRRQGPIACVSCPGQSEFGSNPPGTNSTLQAYVHQLPSMEQELDIS
ncbi:T-lymphocyte surface antigen Ly-9-like [Ahaetulla prasina]|uniref:T-lymphocyte surface antigen Ly-9-like n=1 Tax=Ahaetulla prasina TaxID=499056 RepID=UPI00264824B9|nr:T-lymphocyte surface antigen Ly-9-like [Ahaetulla prasina]